MTGKSMRKTIGTTRRSFLGQAGAGGLALVSGSAWVASAGAETLVDLPLPEGPKARVVTTSFPQKAAMILQRTRPPLLETPFEVFDRGVFTPNDSFFVRWHWAVIPTEVDVNTFRLSVRGHVDSELSMTLKDIVDGLPRVELAAVNQCSGNSRGYTAPPVAGAQWSNGAMGNAKWTGVRLKDVLDRAGVKRGAQWVRFAGLDEPVVDGAPKLMKSLEVDHARDGEVMIAYAMNGEQLPLLNGFPLRLIVPGWYSTYWVKMLDRIEVLDGPDDNFWMKSAYLIPDTPGATMKPGQTGLTMVPINKMVPRSFVTNLRAGATLKAGAKTTVRGIAFGGSTGVKSVEISLDGGTLWLPTVLGRDEGKYSFRQWQAEFVPAAGAVSVMVRCTASDGLAQPATPNWNPGGFMHNAIETVHLAAA
jgi:DMSO/TMAO reductase YedYZ molybdopterin-dependent catalytic subunit